MYRYILAIIFGITIISTTPISAAQKAKAANIPQILSVKDVDTPPLLVKRTAPEYPEIALQEGIEGKVVLEIVVNAKGHVENVKVLKSSNKVLEEAAVKAAKQYVFKPAQKSGKNVAVSIVLPITFQMR